MSRPNDLFFSPQSQDAQNDFSISPTTGSLLPSSLFAVTLHGSQVPLAFHRLASCPATADPLESLLEILDAFL